MATRIVGSGRFDNFIDVAGGDNYIVYNDTLGANIAGRLDGDVISIDGFSEDYKIKVVGRKVTVRNIDTESSEITKVVFRLADAGSVKLQFVDGSLDVERNPNASTNKVSVAGVGLTDVFRNLDDAGIQSKVDTADQFDPATAGPVSSTVLTTNVDDVAFSGGSVDTVKGLFFDTPGDDTYSVGDNIDGNGQTIVEVVVAETVTSLPYVTMTGVDKFNVVMGVTDTVSVDASSFGEDISSINLSGKDGSYLSVSNLFVDGSLTLSVAGASSSTVCASGTMGDWTYSASVQNDDTDGVGGIATFGSAGIDITLGEDDYVCIDINQCTTTDAALASVGALSIGDVNVVVGDAAYATVYVSHCAYNSGAGDAVAGALNFGNLSLDVDNAGSGLYMYVYNCATADEGNATVGNFTMGSIDVQVGDDATEGLSISICNYADAVSGNATVGNSVIGNINVLAGNSVSDALSFDLYNCANASVTGNATVGNLTIGNVVITQGDDISADIDFTVCQYAYADTGNASVGNVTYGDLIFTYGDNGNTSISFTLYNSAFVDDSGDASVGNITLGNIDLDVGYSNSMCLCFFNCADSDGGSATVGNFVVGDITALVDADATACVCISLCASGTDTDSVGNIAVGDVNFYAKDSGSAFLTISAEAENGNVGNITIGTVDLRADASASVGLSISVDAGGNIGNFVMGNINVVLADDGATLHTFSVDLDASGSIGNVTVGNIDIDMGPSSDAYMSFTFCADDDIGNVKFGNLTIDVAESADQNSVYISAYASNGQMGTFSIGNIVMSAAANASNEACAYLWADDGITSVTLGSVDLDAAGGDNFVSFTACISASDDIGAIKVGNVSVNATASTDTVNAYGGFCVCVSANDNTIGPVTVGNVSLVAKAGEFSSATAYAAFCLTDTGDSVGLSTVGNITLNATLAASATQSADAEVTFDFYSNGDIKVGNIVAVAGAVTDNMDNSASMNFTVSLSSTDGNVTVGNITVSGGQENSTSALLDDLDVLTSWLGLTAGGDITVGNIDYRGYANDATIDVSDWEGAAVIYAAQGDTYIYDNLTKNTIYLGAGDDTVEMVSAGVTINKNDVTKIDEIIGFSSGNDVIDFDTTFGDNDFVFVSGFTGSYADFLADAADSMDNDGTDVFAAKVGNSVYVAVDDNNNGTVDLVVKLTGITSVDENDFEVDGTTTV